MAVDWGVFADWVIVTLVISIVVGVSHSFFRVGPRGRSPPSPAGGWTGEFVQVTVPDTDAMLLYGEEALKKGDLDQCVRTAYSAAEEILTSAAQTAGIPTEHTTLGDFARRLSGSGFVSLDEGTLALLDTAIAGSAEPLDRAAATRALSAAFFVRNYFMHAPLSRPRTQNL